YTYDPCSGPTATVSGNATICAGNSTTISAALTGAGPWTVFWSDGFAQGVGSSPATRNVSPSFTTTYTVPIVADQNCAQPGTGSATVNVNQAPSAAISAPTGLCTGISANANVPNAGGGATYVWTIANGSITSGQGTPQIA